AAFSLLRAMGTIRGRGPNWKRRMLNEAMRIEDEVQRRLDLLDEGADPLEGADPRVSEMDVCREHQQMEDEELADDEWVSANYDEFSDRDTVYPEEQE